MIEGGSWDDPLPEDNPIPDASNIPPPCNHCGCAFRMTQVGGMGSVGVGML
jgi:hypothetical protein